MYVYICIYMYMCVYIHIHIYIYVYTDYIYIFMYTYVCIFRMHVCINVCMYVWMDGCVCMHACMYVQWHTPALEQHRVAESVGSWPNRARG